MTSQITLLAAQGNDEVLNLPPLELRESHSLGAIRHVVWGERQVPVERIESIRISPRLSEVLYRLKGGESVIVTARANVKRPSNVDGVLFRGSQGSRWQSHRLLDELRARLDSADGSAVAKEIAASWADQVNFRAERVGSDGAASGGLRPPQLGGLHAIGSHWSLHHQPATVVMPTGTGKTETMLASLTAYRPDVVLVVVPSEVLRDQTVNKVATLGLLRKLRVLGDEARNPVVGIIRRRPKSLEDLSLFDRCNVVVATMSAVSEGTAQDLIPAIADKVDALVVDEAHHVPATGWTAFRTHFATKRVLQFTATPYRRDGKLVDGKVIFEYPLQMAQRDGYFKRIKFVSVYEVDRDLGDESVATTAIEALRADLQAGLDHLLMARCDRIERGKAILEVYKQHAPDLKPVLVHSESTGSAAALKALANRDSRIVVAVNMLGEGFDLPQLKVAAVHDTHKSLAVLLQFTGRFTRSGAKDIGDATVVGNIADNNVSGALERLYSEDADWNELLSEMSSNAAKAHKALVEFLNASRRIDKPLPDEKTEISHHLLRPSLNTLMYHAESFTPEAFFNGLASEASVHRVWLHDASHTLYFVTRAEPPIKWTRSHEVRDRKWDLFILHFDPDQKLLYVSSSDKDSLYEPLAKAVGADKLIAGDVIFRSLGKINRLVFQNVGVKKYGRRNLRFAMYTGTDVAEALSLSEKAGSTKSNVSGTGWENGEQISIGCSYKGRVWTRDPGTIPEFVEWCTGVGGKILDESIDTKDIIKHVMIPKEATSLPDKTILSIEWPLEILRQSEERVVLSRGEEELPVSLFDVEVVASDPIGSVVRIGVRSVGGDTWSDLTMTVGGDHGYHYADTATTPCGLRIGNVAMTLAEYLSNYPFLIRFVDLTELDGNILLEPQQSHLETYPDDRFEAWNWAGVDITKESIWKEDSERRDSIQWRVSQHYLDQYFDIVFDDDAPGEAADLVCLKEDDDHIRLSLVHCKFTRGKTSGERVHDVQEVCSQAVRSGKWKGQFADLCRHVVSREKRLGGGARATRFLRGDSSRVNQLARAARFKEVRLEVVIAQPGLSQKNYSPDQARILGAADSYLKETAGINLDVIAGV